MKREKRNFFRKLNGRVRKSRRKSIRLYRNIVAVIITGVAIGSFLPNFLALTSSNWLLWGGINLIFTFSLLIVFYFTGRWAIRIAIKDTSEDGGYHKNFITGLMASIYVSLLLISNSLWRGILISASVIALIILLYFFTLPRKKK
ncbi:MAG: hypothetical protein Q8P15_02650 [Nanoarchaeota archaeon]|nr:hypothetical protein [Nanoarchaeota archaeon]